MHCHRSLKTKPKHSQIHNTAIYIHLCINIITFTVILYGKVNNCKMQIFSRCTTTFPLASKCRQSECGWWGISCPCCDSSPQLMPHHPHSLYQHLDASGNVVVHRLNICIIQLFTLPYNITVNVMILIHKCIYIAVLCICECLGFVIKKMIVILIIIVKYSFFFFLKK